MKAVVAAFNLEKALVEAFSVITNLRMELFEALDVTLSSVTSAPSLHPPRRSESRSVRPGDTIQWRSGSELVKDSQQRSVVIELVTLVTPSP